MNTEYAIRWLLSRGAASDPDTGRRVLDKLARERRLLMRAVCRRIGRPLVALLCLAGSVNAQQVYNTPPFNPFAGANVVIIGGCPGGVCGRTLPAVVHDMPPIRTRGQYHDVFGSRSGLGEHHLTHYRQIL